MLIRLADLTRILTTLTMWRPLAVCFAFSIEVGDYPRKFLALAGTHSIVVWRKGSDVDEKPTISIRVRNATESQVTRFVTGVGELKHQYMVIVASATYCLNSL